MSGASTCLLLAFMGVITFGDRYNLEGEWDERQLSFWRVIKWRLRGRRERGQRVEVTGLGRRPVFAYGYIKGHVWNDNKTRAATDRFNVNDTEWQTPKQLAEAARKNLICSDDLRAAIEVFEVYELIWETRQTIGL